MLEAQAQEAFSKLEKQKREFDQAYANKVEECKRVAEALVRKFIIILHFDLMLNGLVDQIGSQIKRFGSTD